MSSATLKRTDHLVFYITGGSLETGCVHITCRIIPNPGMICTREASSTEIGERLIEWAEKVSPVPFTLYKMIYGSVP